MLIGFVVGAVGVLIVVALAWRLRVLQHGDLDSTSSAAGGAARSHPSTWRAAA